LFTLQAGLVLYQGYIPEKYYANQTKFSFKTLYFQGVSEELRSLLRDLIPEQILSQKLPKHMGPIHYGSGFVSF